jgi:hypothetical protein
MTIKKKIIITKQSNVMVQRLLSAADRLQRWPINSGFMITEVHTSLHRRELDVFNNRPNHNLQFILCKRLKIQRLFLGLEMKL